MRSFNHCLDSVYCAGFYVESRFLFFDEVLVELWHFVIAVVSRRPGFLFGNAIPSTEKPIFSDVYAYACANVLINNRVTGSAWSSNWVVRKAVDQDFQTDRLSGQIGPSFVFSHYCASFRIPSLRLTLFSRWPLLSSQLAF